MYSHVYIDLPYTCHVDLHCLGNRVLDHMQDDQTVREAAALCLTQLFQYLSTASRRHILGPYILYKDIQPTTLVLKAGHPASFSVLCVYSFVSSDGGFLGFFLLLSILLLYTLYNYTHVYMYIHVDVHACALTILLYWQRLLWLGIKSSLTISLLPLFTPTFHPTTSLVSLLLVTAIILHMPTCILQITHVSNTDYKSDTSCTSLSVESHSSTSL